MESKKEVMWYFIILKKCIKYSKRIDKNSDNIIVKCHYTWYKKIINKIE
ncbi:hypothetical protein CFSAN002368_14368 [Clostridium botulinum A1 str. CFSAN002368]|nr:hypothetical protein CFSAN002368_14368 [Clostridium botulinum A1 str. CFSAN002368]